MSTLSTHILDISTGQPAEGVTVHLEREGEIMATGVTNVKGRITEFVPFLPKGRYQEIADGGHLLNTEKPYELAQAIKEFVAGF